MNIETENKLIYLQAAISKLKGGVKEDITLDTLLEDIGLDSLDVVDLQISYEDDHGVVLTDPVEPIVTVGDLIKALT